MDDLATNGTVPLIFWQPVDPNNLASGAYTYDKIRRGWTSTSELGHAAAPGSSRDRPVRA